MRKNNLLKIGGVAFVFMFMLSSAAYADPWTETSITIYQTDTTKNVGIGTTAPTYEIHGVSGQVVADPFVFQGFSGAWGERDIFSIKTSDYLSTAQDESSLLQVWASGAWSNDADGVALAEFTYTGAIPTVSDRQFYLLGRAAYEGQVKWGISLTDADFWTAGDINGGATGTDCGGTGAACFNNPSFHIAASGDSYINGGNVGIGTTSPSTSLHISGTDQYPFYIDNSDSSVGFQLRPNGTATGYFLSDDTGKLTLEGFKSDNTGTILLRAGNTDRMFIDSSGNVGIGTTSPQGRLHLRTTYDNTEFRFENADGASGRTYTLASDTSGNFKIMDNTAAQDRIYLQSDGDFIVDDGNVGIGTTSPSNTLDVQGTIGATGDISSSSGGLSVSGNLSAYGGSFSIDSGHDLILKGRTGGNGRALVDYTNILYLNYDNDFSNGVYTPGNFSAGGSITAPTLCISSDCRTSWPSSSSGGVSGSGTGGRLALWSSSTALTLTDSTIRDTGSQIGIGTTPSIDLAVGDSDTGLEQKSDGELAIYTNNNEQVRIDSSGNVGIGDTSPDSKLDVSGKITIEQTGRYPIY